MQTREYTVGNQAVSITAKLYRPSSNGPTPVVLEITETVAFRMVTTAGVVKVNDAAATIVSRGSSTTNTPAEARYDWAAGDVDTAGTYIAWFIRTSATGTKEHFPSQDSDDPELEIIIRAVA
jgi:hypothetical protein